MKKAEVEVQKLVLDHEEQKSKARSQLTKNIKIKEELKENLAG